jgi:hypothetical protein
LIRWGNYDITILVEKPVAVSQEQHDRLRELRMNPDFKARIWVAMEYRFIPAIAKLLSLLPTIGDLKMVTTRENRYPFLHKIGAWNRDKMKTGDTLARQQRTMSIFAAVATRDKLTAINGTAPLVQYSLVPELRRVSPKLWTARPFREKLRQSPMSIRPRGNT